MRGWIILLSLVSVPGMAATLSGYSSESSVRIISLLAVFLLIILAGTAAARRRA